MSFRRSLEVACIDERMGPFPSFLPTWYGPVVSWDEEIGAFIDAAIERVCMLDVDATSVSQADVCLWLLRRIPEVEDVVSASTDASLLTWLFQYSAQIPKIPLVEGTSSRRVALDELRALLRGEAVPYPKCFSKNLAASLLDVFGSHGCVRRSNILGSIASDKKSSKERSDAVRWSPFGLKSGVQNSIDAISLGHVKVDQSVYDALSVAVSLTTELALSHVSDALFVALVEMDDSDLERTTTLLVRCSELERTDRETLQRVLVDVLRKHDWIPSEFLSELIFGYPRLGIRGVLSLFFGSMLRGQLRWPSESRQPD
jgi:hypothetical protein